MKFKFQYANTVSFYLEHCDAVLSLACWWCAHFNKKERCNIVHNGLDISFLWLQIVLFTGPKCNLHHISVVSLCIHTHIPICVWVWERSFTKKKQKNPKHHFGCACFNRPRSKERDREGTSLSISSAGLWVLFVFSVCFIWRYIKGAYF